MIHKKVIRVDSGRILLGAAALVQGVQYAQAFRLVHASLGTLALAGGALAGLVVVGAVAYVGNNLPRVRGKTAKRWGTAFFVLTLALTPAVLTPVNWYGMDAGLRAEIGWYSWALAGMLASLPELALGMVALVDRALLPPLAATGKSLSDAGSDASDSLSHGQRRLATLKVAQISPLGRSNSRSATEISLSDAGSDGSDSLSDAQPQAATRSGALSDAPGRPATVPSVLYRCECGFTDPSRFKISGHKRTCAVHIQQNAGNVIPVKIPTRSER